MRNLGAIAMAYRRCAAGGYADRVLDDVDKKLIELLRANSRTPAAELARRVGVNRATVTARIERLTRTGVIESFTIRLADEVDHDAIRGITLIAVSPNRGVEVMRKVRGIPEAEQVHSTIGVWDLVVQLRAATLPAFDTALEQVRGLDGVRDTQTSLLFNSLTR